MREYVFDAGNETGDTNVNKTFAALKAEAETAKTPVELFRIAKQSNDKLLGNIAKAQMLSYSHGYAVEADHYFQNVIPGWTAINNEIHAMLANATAGKSAEEIVAIINEATA